MFEESIVAPYSSVGLCHVSLLRAVESRTPVYSLLGVVTPPGEGSVFFIAVVSSGMLLAGSLFRYASDRGLPVVVAPPETLAHWNVIP